MKPASSISPLLPKETPPSASPALPLPSPRPLIPPPPPPQQSHRSVRSKKSIRQEDEKISKQLDQPTSEIIELARPSPIEVAEGNSKRHRPSSGPKKNTKETSKKENQSPSSPDYDERSTQSLAEETKQSAVNHSPSPPTFVEGIGVPVTPVINKRETPEKTTPSADKMDNKKPNAVSHGSQNRGRRRGSIPPPLSNRSIPLLAPQLTGANMRKQSRRLLRKTKKKTNKKKQGTKQSTSTDSPSGKHAKKRRKKPLSRHIIHTTPQATSDSDCSDMGDDEFFALIESNKERKVQLECVCEDQSCYLQLREQLSGVGTTCKSAGRCFWICCLPPLPSSILNRAAFWPPKREYYFFNEKLSPTKGVKNRKKLRKANKEAVGLRDHWQMSMEHKCITEIRDVECYVLRTASKNNVACVRVRSTRQPPRYTLIYSHPNGSDISDHLIGVPSLFNLAKFYECDVVSYDYSGYGISSGHANETSLLHDIEAVYKFVREDLGVASTSIILYGYSIGTAATVALLSSTPDTIAGTVLLAPPTSMLRVILWKRGCIDKPYEKRRPFVDKFSTFEKMLGVDTLTLVCHGEADVIVPIEHGHAVYEAAPNKVEPLWIENVGHNNIENTRELWIRVRHFINNECPAYAASRDRPVVA